MEDLKPGGYGLALALAWVGAFIFASVMYRLRKGRPIFSPKIPDALFRERWRSGRSLKNIITRFGGARNCLWVAVTQNHLCVGPMFPFNLMFLPEIYGLEHRIPPSAILSIEEKSSFFSGNVVKVTYRDDSGEEQSFEITVKNREQFQAAMRALRGKA